MANEAWEELAVGPGYSCLNGGRCHLYDGKAVYHSDSSVLRWTSACKACGSDMVVLQHLRSHRRYPDPFSVGPDPDELALRATAAGGAGVLGAGGSSGR